MQKPRKKLLWIFLIFFGIPISLVTAFICIAIFNPFHVHEHCIKNTGLALRIYATDHGDRFPADTNGFGNALLLLLKEGYLGETNDIHSSRLITAPGDNGEIFRKALQTSSPIIPDEKCTRIYIQGLSESNSPDIAILFDRYPTPGGDHFRRPWGPLQREVCTLDGSMKVINEEQWPAFAKNQIELLMQNGMTRSLAERYYRLARSVGR